MGEHLDNLETQPPAAREEAHFAALPDFLREAAEGAPGLAKWLSGFHFDEINNRKALARLPVLRKPELMEFQAAEPPFGGFVHPKALTHGRVFMSPGPVWEPQGFGPDPWGATRALYAAGVRAGDILHNAFSYHMTPGGFLLDEGGRALGCLVFPAGVGNTDTQVEAAAALRPKVYSGTPDYLKVMLDRASELGKDLSSFKLALVSGGALFPSLRQEYLERGVNVFQCYATADLGIIAYETAGADGLPNPGMVVNEGLIVEIVRPGTGDPVGADEVGEVVVTSFSTAYPLVRFGTGDLSAFIDEPSPCGRTNRRLKGWMGRADQRTKIKGMFVDPKQVAEIVKRHPGIDRARLVVRRDGEQDTMSLLISAGGNVAARDVEASLRDVTKLGGTVSIVEAEALPNDGKVIADERDYAK
ncbi:MULTISPECIES: phenylacetate--CoA ligase family protein [Mesorhizobium]|uniref:Phenylacetate--CoA ligase family protein n=1 Tax=Mesorhizobium denitrificans TaxID=2294114 RepID=A0A371XEH2_9HYPH|nr:MULTISPECIES: AMP-binding protein [Mesorhizobium]RFC67434.1 phenylacetate--CoA ligase family protein [Mesorhizobium denitrificans]